MYKKIPDILMVITVLRDGCGHEYRPTCQKSCDGLTPTLLDTCEWRGSMRRWTGVAGRRNRSPGRHDLHGSQLPADAHYHVVINRANR